MQEFRITIKEVADTVNVSNGLLQALHMIKSTLDMHCLCNQFSPRLSPPSRGSTVLKSAETMSRMITGDKSTGGYNLEKKHDSMSSQGQTPLEKTLSSPRPNWRVAKAGQVRSSIKTMPVVFFDFVRSYTVKTTLKDAPSD